MTKEKETQKYEPQKGANKATGFLLLLIAVIIINALFASKSYKVIVSNGEVIRSGEAPIQLIDVVEYCESIPQINITNTIRETQNNIQELQNKGQTNIFESVKLIVLYIATPLTLIINGILIIVYMVGIVFI